MLRHLSIRDVVLIDRLELDFDPGLGVLTGETGAGKSILLDSLGLALGMRADAGLIRPGAEQAIVAAMFDVAPDHPAHNLLAEHGLEADEGTIMLRRIVGRDGRSRAFVNDQPATAGLLRQIGEMLVEIQGQFERFALAAPAVQRSALDLFGNLSAKAAEVSSLFAAWSDARCALADAEADVAAARLEEEQLRHDVAELNDLAPAADEEARLASQRQLLQNGERLMTAFNETLDDLAGDTGAEPALQRASRTLTRAAEYSGGRLDPIIAALDRSTAETRDALQELQALAHAIETDTGQLETVEGRLFALRAAARKHNSDVDHLAEVHTKLAGRLAALDGNSDRLTVLAKAAESARRAYVASGERLSAGRHKAAKALDRAVGRELPPLKLDNATFKSGIERLPETSWSATGLDAVEFRIATNPGGAPGPLGKIASGGELSRFLLALKVVLTDAGGATTLIFDEVDAGVGGATAAAVGERLAALADASNRQILVVTHSPQVAAVGERHWRVSKDGDGASVVTSVVPLDQPARREEIARMLAGAEITDEARAAAERLLGGTQPPHTASPRDAA
ncbi:MAG: DNA repair protein RecN (Recombination protein N) [Alphaproteobacteria bacterium]|jgi:DNA repair protein RecN (Recombination protein N)